MALDYSNAIRQMNEAIGNCVKTVANMQAATDGDGVDRSGSIASINRDKASYEKQLAEIEKKLEPTPPAEPSKKSPK